MKFCTDHIFFLSSSSFLPPLLKKMGWMDMDFIYNIYKKMKSICVLCVFVVICESIFTSHHSSGYSSSFMKGTFVIFARVCNIPFNE